MLEQKKSRFRVAIEGPDGVGKTTISQALARELDLPYFKFKAELTMFSGDPIDRVAMLKWGTHEQLSMIEQCGIGVVMDRFIPSESVYSRVYERATAQALLIRYDSWWRSLGGVYVFLDKPSIKESDWDDEHVDYKNYDKLREGYQRFTAQTTVDHIVIDTTECDTKKSVSQIESWLNRSFK